MSLQLAAQHLAAHGRGPDTTLVHMAPQEVAGLQALAKAHGGSLTTNPDTGLPEAGFLSSILPMVVGAGLAATGIGAPLAAGIVGAGYGVATGSLQKGLMAGLGAYGGAGLAGGLMGAGAAGAAGAAEAGAAGLGAMGPQTAAQLGTGFEASMAAQGAAPTLGATGASMGAQTAGQLGAGFQADMAAQGVQPSAINADLAVKNAVPTVTKAPTFMENISQMGRGVQNLGTEAGREAFMGQAASKGVEATGVGGMKGLMQYGLAGLAPVAVDMMTPKQQEIAEKEKLKPYMYAYEPGRATNPQQGYTGAFTGERTYFNPVYTRTAAGGGLMDIGPVEAMSRSNQSQMAPAYAQGGVSDMAVNPYTGAETFAEGGDTKAVRRVEDDPYYTMSGQSGDAFKYLMGQTPITPRTPAPAPAAVTPVQSTVQPVAPETNSAMGMVGRLLGNTVFGAAFGKQPGQGGEWVDADTNVKPYSFDPVTGGFTAVAPPKVFRPREPEFDPVNALVSGFGGGGGYAQGGIASLAQGGQSHLGDYSDGGRLLRGPGDGVSDDIPATIGDKRPARLADGEFVVPARIVSELGNGSTEAGARKLYAMMDRVQKARGKTVGKDRVAVNTKAEKMLPA